METSNFRKNKIAEALLATSINILPTWLSGELRGDEFVALNPTRDDTNLGSFSVNIKTGEWNDFADDTFQGADLISLYMRLNNINEESALNKLEKAVTVQSGSLKPTPTAVCVKAPVISAPAPDKVHLPPDMHVDLGEPSAQWKYKTAEGKTAFYIQRFDTEKSKETRPVSYNPEKDDWQYRLPQEPLPLYNLDLIESDKEATVIVVEGEKTADAAAKLFPGHVCITSAGGSNNALKSDWSPLYGRKVTLIPDADEPGVKYVQSVAAELAVNGANVSIIDTTEQGWSNSEDVADHSELDSGWLDNAIPLSDWKQLKEMDQYIVEAAARMPLFDYDRQKDKLVSLLGNVSKRSLDKSVNEERARFNKSSEPEDVSDGIFPVDELWSDPVDGKELVHDIKAVIQSHVVLTEHQALAAALWTLLTYVLAIFRVCPRLLIYSPEKRCGKTTLLEVLQALCNRALATANITPAALFRSIEAWSPTLIIDEADTFVHGNDELRGVLNSGHTRSTAYVIRTVGDDHMPAQFSTFAPIALGMIKRPPDTIFDRSIQVMLQRKLTSDAVKALPLEADIDYQPIRQKCLRWAEDNLESLKTNSDLAPTIDNDRARDNWAPLMVIAKRCNALSEVQEACRNMAVDNSENIMEMLLEDMQQIFQEENKSRIPSITLVKKLVALEERPWSEYSHGREMTQPTLAKLMKSFGVKTRQAKNGSKNHKHFFLEDLQPVFDRYLAPQSGDRKVAEEVAVAEPQRYPATLDSEVAATETLPATLLPKINLLKHDVTGGSGVAAKTRGKRFSFSNFEGTVS
jgi:hypothetical protein